MSVDVQKGVPLSRYTSIHVGGPATHFARVTSIEELQDALRYADDKGIPIHILGGGSNTFFMDGGFSGLVIKMEGRNIRIEGSEVTAESGAVTRLVVGKAVDQGLGGMERLAGIPGTIGGAVRGNAGSFGSETCDHLTRVTALHRTAKGWIVEELPRESLEFSYRDSSFKRDFSYVVWNATFSLLPGDVEQGRAAIAHDLAVRREKQPYNFPSMGSVFKNPSLDIAAGKLIEEAGLKGYTVGGAQVSEKHGNFIVNVGRATSEDVCNLMDEIARRVYENSGIRLEKEIVAVGTR